MGTNNGGVDKELFQVCFIPKCFSYLHTGEGIKAAMNAKVGEA